MYKWTVYRRRFSFRVPSWFLRISRNAVHEAFYENLFCLGVVLISHLHTYRKVNMKGCRIWKHGWPGMLNSTTNPKISTALNQVLCNLQTDRLIPIATADIRAENCLLFCFVLLLLRTDNASHQRIYKRIIAYRKFVKFVFFCAHDLQNTSKQTPNTTMTERKF